MTVKIKVAQILSNGSILRKELAKVTGVFSSDLPAFLLALYTSLPSRVVSETSNPDAGRLQPLCTIVQGSLSGPPLVDTSPSLCEWSVHSTSAPFSNSILRCSSTGMGSNIRRCGDWRGLDNIGEASSHKLSGAASSPAGCESFRPGSAECTNQASYGQYYCHSVCESYSLNKIIKTAITSVEATFDKKLIFQCM